MQTRRGSVEFASQSEGKQPCDDPETPPINSAPASRTPTHTPPLSPPSPKQASERHPHGLGALQKCELRLKRLEKLNEVLQALSDPIWASSDPSSLLIRRLKENPSFPAVRLVSRPVHLKTLLLSHPRPSCPDLRQLSLALST